MNENASPFSSLHTATTSSKLWAAAAAGAADAVVLSSSSPPSESSELDLSESMAATAAFSVESK